MNMGLDFCAFHACCDALYVGKGNRGILLFPLMLELHATPEEERHLNVPWAAYGVMCIAAVHCVAYFLASYVCWSHMSL